MSVNQIIENSKEKRLCSIAGIRFSASLGGPLSAFYFISRNFSVLGNKLEAKKNLFYGVFFTILIFGSPAFIPSFIMNKIPNTVIPIIYIFFISAYANKMQGSAIKEGILEGIKKYSKLKILGISTLSCMISFGFSFIVLLSSTINLSSTIDGIIGFFYHQGVIVSQNDVEAAKWLRKAAEHNDASAENNLGTLYHLGRGVQKNDVEAFRWYLKSARQGNTTGENNAAYAYQVGQGVTQNDIKAFQWFLKSAMQGDAIAEVNVGYAFHTGQGVTQNNIEATKWMRKAADQGIAQAQLNLALAYHNGIGVPKNNTEAIKWLKKAAAQGFPPAQNILQQLSESEK